MTLVDSVVRRANTPDRRTLAEQGADRIIYSEGHGNIAAGRPDGLGFGRVSFGEIYSDIETIRFLGAATADGSAFGPSLTDPIIRGIALPGDLAVRQPRLLDFVDTRPTSASMIRYGRETTRTDSAAETAAGTAAPEETYELEPVEAQVRDIPTTLTVYRETLQDREELASLLEGKLGGSVRGRLEHQIIRGDGTGENLLGVLSTSGIGSVDRDATNELRYDAIRRGITAVRLTLADEPNAVIVHPSDYDDLLNERDADDALVVSGAERSSRTLLSIPVVPSTATPEGTVVVGAFDLGTTLRVREGLSLMATDSHSDYFTKRQALLIASIRAALLVRTAGAFAKVLL